MAKQNPMARRRLIRTVVIVVVLVELLAVGGYIAWYHLWPGNDRIDVVGSNPTILVRQKRHEGMDALAEGTLYFDTETGCLMLEGLESDSALHLVWSRGTTPVVVDNRRGVRVNAFLGRFGGTTLLEGDRVSLSGGTIDLPADVAARSGCDTDRAFLVSDEGGRVLQH